MTKGIDLYLVLHVRGYGNEEQYEHQSVSLFSYVNHIDGSEVEQANHKTCVPIKCCHKFYFPLRVL